MSLTDAMQMVVDDCKRISTTCRTCGVKTTDICKQRDCETFPELVAQMIIVDELKKKGFLKQA